MRSWWWSFKARAGATAGLTAALLALGVSHGAGADPDEPADLRVAKGARSRIVLSWAAPQLAADSYTVRRCTLPSLRTRTYAQCIATGLGAETYSDTNSRGSVFYLVSGVYGGLEGSLGDAFDGSDLTPRAGAACGTGGGPGTLTLRVVVDDAASFCGAQVTVTYPAAAATYSTSSATGIIAGWTWITNDQPPGMLRIATVSPGITPATGPGEMGRIDFVDVDCPIPDEAFRLQASTFVDCASNSVPGVACHLEVVR
jgi:hypothetical protein